MSKVIEYRVWIEEEFNNEFLNAVHPVSLDIDFIDSYEVD